MRARFGERSRGRDRPAEWAKNVCKNSNKQSKYAEMNVYVNDYCMYACLVRFGWVRVRVWESQGFMPNTKFRFNELLLFGEWKVCIAFPSTCTYVLFSFSSLSLFFFSRSVFRVIFSRWCVIKSLYYCHFPIPAENEWEWNRCLFVAIAVVVDAFFALCIAITKTCLSSEQTKTMKQLKQRKKNLPLGTCYSFCRVQYSVRSGVVLVPRWDNYYLWLLTENTYQSPFYYPVEKICAIRSKSETIKTLFEMLTWMGRSKENNIRRWMPSTLVSHIFNLCVSKLKFHDLMPFTWGLLMGCANFQFQVLKHLIPGYGAALAKFWLCTVKYWMLVVLPENFHIDTIRDGNRT